MGVNTGVRRGHHPQMVERPSGKPVKVRRVFRVGGISTPINFGVHNNSLKNLRRGLLERVFFVENKEHVLVPAPKPEAGVYLRLDRFRKRLLSIVGPHSRCSEERFCSFYTGRKKTIYEGAVRSLTERAVEKKDAFLTTFVKAEKINFTAKPDPAPRVIQPRNVRYNVEVGRYLRPLEHHIYRAIDHIWGGPTIMKGYTVNEIGDHFHTAWNQFRNPVAIGFDMKRFDQHVSRAALEWEHSCYLGVFSNDTHLATLLEWQIANKGWGRASDGSIKYNVDGCRMSGDMNTAMGNCLLACAIVWDFVKSAGIKARLFNNGDDCVLIMERSVGSINDRLERHWESFGFQCIVEPPVYLLEKIEFCQMQPVYDGSQYVMTRNPHICLSKDAYSIGPFNNVMGARKWARAVGDCGLALTGGLPLMQAFYSMLIRESGEVGGRTDKDLAFSSGFAALAKMGNRKASPVTEESRFSFYLAFGIKPDAQRALEGHYDQHTLEWAFVPQGTPKIDNNESWLLKDLK